MIWIASAFSKPRNDGVGAIRFKVWIALRESMIRLAMTDFLESHENNRSSCGSALDYFCVKQAK